MVSKSCEIGIETTSYAGSNSCKRVIKSNDDRSYLTMTFPLTMAYAAANIKGKNTRSCYANHKISR